MCFIALFIKYTLPEIYQKQIFLFLFSDKHCFQPVRERVIYWLFHWKEVVIDSAFW